MRGGERGEENSQAFEQPNEDNCSDSSAGCADSHTDSFSDEDDHHTERVEDEQLPPSDAVDRVPGQETGGDVPDLRPAAEEQGHFLGHAETVLEDCRCVVGHDVDACREFVSIGRL